MNTPFIINRRNLLSLLIPGVLFTLLFLISKSSAFLIEPTRLSIAITLDLLVTIPLIYFITIRKTTISKRTVFMVVGIGLFIAYRIIPKEHQIVLPFLKIWFLPLAEISLITYALLNLKKARKNSLRSKTHSSDFYDGLKSVSQTILPPFLARITATEIATVYYGLIYWKKRTLKENEFSNYKKSSSISIFLGIILIIGVETTVFHFVMEESGSANVWLLTILSIYSIVQLVGFLKSLIKRPISFNGDRLYLRYGIMKETVIQLDTISSIELSSKAMKDKSSSLSIFGKLESHNVIIHLKEKETLYSLYGIKRQYESISFYVDEPQRFFDKTCEAVEQLKK